MVPWKEDDGWWFSPVKGPAEGPFETEEEALELWEADIDMWEESGE